jgi:hypothetical protein
VPDCVVVVRIKPELGDLRVPIPASRPRNEKRRKFLPAEAESDQLALLQPSEENKKAVQELYANAKDLLFRTLYLAASKRAR